MTWLVARLSEPSTWAGFGTVLAAIAAAVPALAPYAGAVATACGTIAVAFKEGKPAT